MKKFNIYLEDKMGQDALVRAGIDEDTLNRVIAAFELSSDIGILEKLRIEEVKSQPVVQVGAI